MRILLVYPKPTQESPQKTPPLSILYIGVYAERRGHEVFYFDERWDNDFDEKLTKVDVVGVSAMSGFQLKRALGFLKRAHEVGKTTIIGGVHATIAPNTLIPEHYIDFIVSGEGEKALLYVLHKIETKEVSERVVIKDSLLGDEIESPIDEKTLPYFRLASQSNDVMLPASRGCINSCGFCYNSAKPDGGKWRPIPLETWLKDLDYLLEQGINISFLQVGDDWLGNKERLFAIGHELAKRNIKWHPSLRANQIDEELALKLRSMRCVGVSIGAESGSDDILKLMNKRIKVQNTINTANILAACRIKPLYYFILGIPTETQEQMNMTMDLADQLYKIHRGNCSIAFFGFDPLMGTKLYKIADDLGMSVPKTLSDCCERERCNTDNPIINNIYYIAGLTFHRTKGDKTDKNFPGVKRLLILPFEILCSFRWKYRFFKYFELEKFIIKKLLRIGSRND